ncbi:MAG: DNA replication/repair protein RecF [Ardenticatenaceae bacterium]|nr:DNA replication/repair protein RecF [Ardenticatenaceae bacterium]
MILSYLSLTNFRNYGRLEVNFSPGMTLLYGPNAQGKTNILESIYYLATTRSPQASADYQIINWEAMEADDQIVVGRIVAQVQLPEGPRHIEMRLIQEKVRGSMRFRREALLDRRKVRLMDLLGNLRVVLFLPSDVEMIGGPPATRRRYIDILLCQVDPTYCRTLSTYNKVLEQRNAALRQHLETGRGRDVIRILTDDLVQKGAVIIQSRAKYMRHLARVAQRIHYESLTDGRETLRLAYLPRLQGNGLSQSTGDEMSGEMQQLSEKVDWLAGQSDYSPVEEWFSKVVQSQEARDLSSGVTTVGPHRDDWRFWINGRQLAHYGSRGQQRSAMLAFKLAEIEFMREITGDFPILLLDDVVAELDKSRRALLLSFIQERTQAFLTSTDSSMFPSTFLRSTKIFVVKKGRLEEETNQSIKHVEEVEDKTQI